MNWVLVGELFGVLMRVTQNRPDLNDKIPEWLGQIQAFITGGTATAQELNALKMQIVQMTLEKREPTQQEWDDMRARSDAASDTIQNADLDN